MRAAVGASEGTLTLTDWDTGSTLIAQKEAAGASQYHVPVTTSDALAQRYGLRTAGPLCGRVQRPPSVPCHSHRMATSVAPTPRWPCPKCAAPAHRAVELTSQTDGVSTFTCGRCGNTWTTLRAESS